ncbi:lasso peptide biosynthesis B2 protein [Mycetohabitans sp. B8]|uniref:Transglutaminase n=1 Tax=Mycetohabitans sp. TaxID=2571162 RepID=A0A6B9HD60_9BURK|nr:lasso peptide biosynthesis B2 protein [Mycetohabitans sp. B8]MCG1042044.1 lasso peptide biosynthesis B2 protein [Mycetohabitans sp. B8]QGY72946.1 transglutaminase [Mycetohabitans sp.]
MPHHLMPHVFGACFAKQLILLDVVRDRYAVLTERQSAALASQLGWKDARFAPAEASQPVAMLEELQRAHWVSATSFPEVDAKLNTVSPSPTTGGMSANGWKLPEDAFAHRPAWTHIARALLVLSGVHRCAARRGLAGLLQLCTRAHREASLRVGAPDDYAPFVNTLNWACLFYPRPTKCLEWSVALTLLCARAGLAAKLVIGVQSFPFYAHAWSEAEGVVIGDSPLRRQELAVILECPHPLLSLPL